METAKKNLQGQKLSPTDTVVHTVTHKQRGVVHKMGHRGPLSSGMCLMMKLLVGHSGQGQGSKPHTEESYTLFPVQLQRVSPI